MTSQQATDSPQVKLVHSFIIEGFGKGDLNLIANQLHKDLRRIYHPRSVGMPEQTKEEYIEHLAGVISLLPDGSQPVIRIVLEVPGTVVFHFTNKAETLIEVDLVRESIFIVQTATEEDGNLKIKQMDEFTDSKAHLDFFKAVSEAIASRESTASYAA